MAHQSIPTCYIFRAMMSWFQENYGAALSNPILQSVLIIWGAVIAAKIADMIFTKIFKRIVDKTQTSLDDQILQLLHRPIFYTILFIYLFIFVYYFHNKVYLFLLFFVYFVVYTHHQFSLE